MSECSHATPVRGACGSAARVEERAQWRAGVGGSVLRDRMTAGAARAEGRAHRCVGGGGALRCAIAVIAPLGTENQVI